jgi:hypothetical protein
MGQDPTPQRKSGLFLTAQEASPSAADRVSFAQERRHVLPKDLPNAVKHLTDEELDRLLTVTLAEATRRGRHTAPTDKPSPSREVEAPVSLTRGQLNAVRAAFNAGITPARIARQFALSQSDVRTALKSDKGE